MVEPRMVEPLGFVNVQSCRDTSSTLHPKSPNTSCLVHRVLPILSHVFN